MSWVNWCGKMLKKRKVFLSVLGLNSQPRDSKSITTQPPHTSGVVVIMVGVPHMLFFGNKVLFVQYRLEYCLCSKHIESVAVCFFFAFFMLLLLIFS